MNILIVYVHHEKKSFTSALKDLAVKTLSEQGHKVKVSDLYTQGFKALADKHDFMELSNQEYFNYMLEQKNAAVKDLFTEDIKVEQEKVKWADFIIIQTPIWWFSVPAILKGWFDRVFATGVTWDFGAVYDKGLLRSKKGMLSITTAGPHELYQPNGAHQATIEQVLYPINHGTLYFCGMDVLPPFVAWSVFQAGDEGRKKYLEEYRQRLLTLEDTKPMLKHSQKYGESQMKKTILITGATGTIGKEIVNQLKDNAAVKLRACYHSQKPEIEGVEWVKLDYSKPETITAAFSEVDRAFLLTPFTDKTVKHVGMLVDAAKNAGVRYLVRLSAQGADEKAPFLPGKWHWQSEQLVKKSGIRYTIIRPTFFMQNFITAYGDTIKSQNSIYSPAGDGRAGFIDPYDVAAVAVKLLISEGHDNKTYELTGPEAISYADAADTLTKVLGRKITYVNISPEDARKNLEKMRMPDWMIEALLGLADIIKKGYTSSLTENVEKVTGNKPRTFEVFAKNNISRFTNVVD
jgi:NAD(P)H dehydrogenase (quinone)